MHVPAGVTQVIMIHQLGIGDHMLCGHAGTCDGLPVEVSPQDDDDTDLVALSVPSGSYDLNWHDFQITSRVVSTVSLNISVIILKYNAARWVQNHAAHACPCNYLRCSRSQKQTIINGCTNWNFVGFQPQNCDACLLRAGNV